MLVVGWGVVVGVMVMVVVVVLGPALTCLECEQLASRLVVDLSPHGGAAERSAFFMTSPSEIRDVFSR